MLIPNERIADLVLSIPNFEMKSTKIQTEGSKGGVKMYGYSNELQNLLQGLILQYPSTVRGPWRGI
jgi:hypothetical protein